VSTPTPAPGAPVLPPGTFRIDRDGVWRHEGQEVTHPGVLRNLYDNLRAEGEAHYLQVGPRQIAVDVDDAPFVVTRVENLPESGDSGSSLRIHLSDGSVEPLDPADAWIGPNDAPYCRVKARRFVARFAVAAWLQLAGFVEEEAGTGRLTLVLGGRRTALPRRPSP
jgi:uncharacterized protein